MWNKLTKSFQGWANRYLSPLIGRISALTPRETIGLAVFLFSLLFALQSWGLTDFWWSMGAVLFLLLLIALPGRDRCLRSMLDDVTKNTLLKTALGFLAGGLLYAIFWVSNQLILLIHPDLVVLLKRVYYYGAGDSDLRIMLLITFLIAPGEEIFWRGFVQHHLAQKKGALLGMLFATMLYSLAHLTTLNPLLIAAALVAGLFWGELYRRYQSITVNIVSHLVFDLAAFVIFPFQGGL